MQLNSEQFGFKRIWTTLNSPSFISANFSSENEYAALFPLDSSELSRFTSFRVAHISTLRNRQRIKINICWVYIAAALHSKGRKMDSAVYFFPFEKYLAASYFIYKSIYHFSHSNCRQKIYKEKLRGRLYRPYFKQFPVFTTVFIMTRYVPALKLWSSSNPICESIQKK